MNEEKYIISISKEELGAMQVTSYPGAISVIETPSQAHMALRALAKEKMVGFDTETKPSFRKGCRHNVALMQISTADRCFLFRLNKLGICAELKAFLENPDIMKIGLSVHDDFGAIRRTEDFEPGGFVDLQELVRKYDIADISLQKIYAIVFGERISKGQRLTNWEADTLTEAQQAYAALDAWACLKLYRYFESDSFNPLLSPFRHLYVPPEPAPKPKPEEKECTAAAPQKTAAAFSPTKSARRRMRRKKAKERRTPETAATEQDNLNRS